VYLDEAELQAAEALNAHCRCASVDLAALRGTVEARLRASGLPVDLASSHPHLFAQMPVFVCAQHAERMAEVVRAVEGAVALPAYREAALAQAPAIARHDPGVHGGVLGFDFHLSAQGPKLIEINTNAGGGLLAAMLGEAALACCGISVTPAQGLPGFEQQMIDTLIAEWQRAGRTGRPAGIAIVDHLPATQYLHPEFLLAQSALRRAGIATIIADPGELGLQGGELHAGGSRIDLVYNRLTDFELAAPAHSVLREAYLSGAAVVTPNPRAHALYADKRMLGLLGDEKWLRTAGLEPQLAALLGDAVPRTAVVRREDGARLWQERRGLFFKPFAGYGSRGAYRGDKLTRRVFEEILGGGYVAQALVPPGERMAALEGQAPLKFDVRNYAYGGNVQLLAARLWRGQTTNFRSEGGGFAPVFVLP
jgi:glutathione synthase/RimK-type ligase-like ATP-grasp enzyme